MSFLPDGSDLRTYASGIRAPIGLAFYPGTGDLFVSMNQRDDLGARTPGDWLALVRAGQAWGFPDCYGQGGAACVGVPLPTAVLDKHAAAGGVAIVKEAAFVSEWARARVLRVTLTPSGSGYIGSAKVFLTGLENPLPVAAMADGSLLVGDWLSGRVYRVVQTS